jgi:D-beta-D-heptose 7-phosphate kinase/D-beta-D-heptose 1-phosphate adenosyltransferase
MYDKLLKTVANLGRATVLVAGDYMLDVYSYGDALRISPEAPVPVLRVTRTEYRCGGAGSVAVDLAGLGAVPVCLGVIGDDENGRTLAAELAKSGADVADLAAAGDRSTTTKHRLIGLAQHRHRQQLIRMDAESTADLDERQRGRILRSYRDRLGCAAAVCLQDYNKGVLSDPVCREMIALAAKEKKTVLVDPALGGDYSKYAGATAITPNRKEAAAAVGFEIDSIEAAAAAAEQLAAKLDLEAVVITLDSQGAYLRTGGRGLLVPTRARSVYDVTGAGDIVLATLAVALAAGSDYETAVQLANITGGIEVEKFGAAAVTIEEIINEILSSRPGAGGKIHGTETLCEQLDWHRQQGRSIVFTNGCFDVLHRGHIEFLRFCKLQGAVLVVGLNSDRSVRQIKGPGRPINNQYDRAAVLAALESVDYVTLFDEPDPLKLIQAVGPDVLVKGRDWADKGVVGSQFVESRGGKVVLAPLVEGKSSTGVIEKIKSIFRPLEGSRK